MFIYSYSYKHIYTIIYIYIHIYIYTRVQLYYMQYNHLIDSCRNLIGMMEMD